MLFGKGRFQEGDPGSVENQGAADPVKTEFRSRKTWNFDGFGARFDVNKALNSHLFQS